MYIIDMKDTIKIHYITKPELLKPIFNNFLNNIPKEYRYMYLRNNLEDNILQNIPNNIILFNEKNIKIANFLLNKYLSQEFNKNNIKNDWTICITKNNFMFGLPFTLQNIIFLPQDYIISSITSDNTRQYTTTLIHEQLHIYQRYNINTWNDNIQKNSNWKLLNNNYFYDNSNIIYNPDTSYLNNQYGYKYYNNIYVGYLNKDLKAEWINIKTNKICNENFLPKYEHPYEELAYMISNDLINKY